MEKEPPPAGGGGGTKTYAEILNGKRSHIPEEARSFEKIIEEGKSELVPVRDATVYGTEPFIKFSSEEIDTLSGWLHLALIGKFSQRKPTLSVIQQGIDSLRLHGDYSIGHLDSKHIIINFTKDEDYYRMFSKKLWFIGGSPMGVLKYTYDFSPEVKSPIAPVWVSLPRLPLVFYDKAVLYSIASVLGNPLKLDEATATKTRTHLARFCVKIDVSKPLVKRMRLGTEDYAIWQHLEYEDIPSYCSFCKHLGHSVVKCYWKQTAGFGNMKEVPNRVDSMPQLDKNPLQISKIWAPKDISKNIKVNYETGEPSIAGCTSNIQHENTFVPVIQNKIDNGTPDISLHASPASQKLIPVKSIVTSSNIPSFTKNSPRTSHIQAWSQNEVVTLLSHPQEQNSAKVHRKKEIGRSLLNTPPEIPSHEIVDNFSDVTNENNFRLLRENSPAKEMNVENIRGQSETKNLEVNLDVPDLESDFEDEEEEPSSEQLQNELSDICILETECENVEEIAEKQIQKKMSGKHKAKKGRKGKGQDNNKIIYSPMHLRKKEKGVTILSYDA